MSSPLLEQVLTPQRTALLVVDMQEEFTHPESRVHRAFAARRGIDLSHLPPYNPRGPSNPGDPNQDEIPTIRRLIEFCRVHQIPVLWARMLINDENTAPYWKLTGKLMCVEGEWTTAFSAGLEPAPDEPIITKTRHSAFHRTKLEDTLRTMGVETLLVAGRGTTACVEGACRDAMANDFIAVVVSDCCAALDEDNDRACAKIGFIFGFASTSDEVMALLAR